MSSSRRPHCCARSAAHLAGTALDNHEAVLADGTSLLGVGQRRAGIGGLERLVVVVRHCGRKRAKDVGDAGGCNHRLSVHCNSESQALKDGYMRGNWFLYQALHVLLAKGGLLRCARVPQRRLPHNARACNKQWLRCSRTIRIVC
jgi:hypothetical protein